MSDHSRSTKTTNSHVSTASGSVANSSSSQKLEPIDYTADESMIAVSRKFVFF